MNRAKILLICICTIMLVACATKELGAEAFKNFSAKQILAEGEGLIAKHKYNDAVKRFEAIDALYPFAPEAKQGQLDVIYAYYKSEDYASALAAADRYIHLYPVGKHTDYAYYMKGIVNFEKDRTFLQKIYANQTAKLDLAPLQDAFIDFGLLIKSFPESVYANDAKKRMLYIRSILAQSELEVAKFYFEHKAYVAAANRASYVAKHFAGTPQIVEALKIMKDSYNILDADKKAKDVQRILNLNFPNNRL